MLVSFFVATLPVNVSMNVNLKKRYKIVTRERKKHFYKRTKEPTKLSIIIAIKNKFNKK